MIIRTVFYILSNEQETMENTQNISLNFEMLIK